MAISFARLFWWVTPPPAAVNHNGTGSGGTSTSGFVLDCNNRGLLFVLVGLLLLLASGTMAKNACVSPVSVL
jgi:hypothetical protein